MAIIQIIISAVIFLFFSGCTTSVPAPIINGWQQASAKQSNYRVQKGDTLYSIAWAFDLDFKELAKINCLCPPYALKVGQMLKMSSFSVKVEPLINYKFTNKWQWPTQGKIIRNFSLGVYGDKGIDINGKFNQPVVATTSGVVVYSGSGLRGYGNLIIIKHNETFLSAYAYNKKLLVKEGMFVKSGQIIALMGNRGNNSAEQGRLHFEIRQNGKPINPTLLLR